MSKMQIVIEIPEVFYEALKETDTVVSGQRSGKTLMSVIYNAVANGTPLPKGHGRLKDVDKIIRDGISKGFCEWYDEMKYAPTIIEADTNKEDNI